MQDKASFEAPGPLGGDPKVDSGVFYQAQLITAKRQAGAAGKVRQIWARYHDRGGTANICDSHFL